MEGTAVPDRRWPPDFFTIISLNTNKRADLGGLPALLRENRPSFVFLQELNVPHDRLLAAVGGQGYLAYRSELIQHRRTIAILSNIKCTVIDLMPGFLQKLVLEKFSIFHIYTPTDPKVLTKNNFFQQLSDFIAQENNEIIMLIGDFNCIIDAKDFAQTNDGHGRFNPSLRDLVNANNLYDAYRVLHPVTLRFSWYRRGFSAARLDRAYVPPLLEGRIRVARYIPTTSDHHAFLLKMELTGLVGGEAAVAAPRPPAHFYWKLNTSLLKERDFLPAFRDMWRPVVNLLNNNPGEAGAWWENQAKPTIVSFCKQFARQVAARKAETRRFFTRALELAMEENDWASIEACKAKLAAFDKEAAAGAAIRTRQPVADGEVPGLFHTAMEGRHGPSPGLLAVKTADKRIVREAKEVEEEILSFFNTLFQGRHVATADRPEPFDSGSPFIPDRERAAAFLEGLPALTVIQREGLERPFSVQELEAAIEAAAAAKSPGLDGLSYELYKTIMPIIGQPLVAAFNDMLEAGILQPSLREGVVRLLPKVRGVPAADQLRPITLLNTDYKLLTKMLVNRLLPLLPDLLQTTQLCAVEGRSIFDGAASVLSAAAYLHQHQLPGFLVSLDFYHAYDRICLQWVDLVLEAMGFGETVRGWVAALHRDNTAAFMLHGLSPAIPVTFSFRQGDPLAQILYIIQEEPLLIRLQNSLHGLRFGGIREASLGYVDDVAAISSREEDLLVLDSIVADYEAASGAILNRNKKSVILGLGAWEGRQDWPIVWLQSATSVKLYGVTFAPDFTSTVQLSWERVVGGLEATLRLWTSRSLPHLMQKKEVLHTYALSKLWYLAQILPLPAAFLRRILRSASNFLWGGRLERLAWAELEAPKAEGGLGVANIASRARALLLKQACHRLNGGGQPRAHLSYWLGLKLLRYIPSLRAGLHAERLPEQYGELAAGLLEVLGLDWVRPEALKAVTASDLYRAFRGEPPTPKIKLRLPAFPWRRIWGRLALASLPQPLFEAGFSLLNNILPTGERRHRLRLAASPKCDYCGAAMENVLHAFTACTRVGEAWEFILFTASKFFRGPISDSELLFLKFPIVPAEIHIIYAVLAFAELVWDSRAGLGALKPEAVRVRLSKPPPPFKSIFKL